MEKVKGGKFLGTKKEIGDKLLGTEGVIFNT